MTDSKERANEDVYRCQFCEKESNVQEWTDDDRCPYCKKKYDSILAQEGDD